MAVDLQVVFPQQVIELRSVKILQISPPTLDIIGDDFRSIDEVQINELLSPEVIVLSKTRMLARIPDAARNMQLQSVTVISNNLAITAQSILRFRLGRTASKTSGILKLVQTFLKLLFTTPGKDIFAPKLGAAALKNIGQTFGAGQGGSIVSDFVVSVATTQRQLTAIQARDPSIPLDERLLSAKVTAANFDRNEAALVVSIELLSQTGKTALANVVV